MTAERIRILDVGCGSNKTPGAVGIDCRAFSGVDLVHDVELVPWPIESGQFDVIVLRHIVEHVSDIGQLLKEVHRVGKPGAEVRIETPHFSSVDSWRDPSHRYHLSLHSFRFFTAAGYLHDGAAFEVESATLTFRKSIVSRVGALLFRLSPRHYEQNLAYVIPALDIQVVLRVVKGSERRGGG